MTLVVSLARQRITVFDRDGAVTSAPISSGKPGHRTPTGVFSILQKNRRHFSNLYAGAPMPNMQRLTWSGIALHAGALPGYPASHGCVRLPHSFSQKLFGMTELGTRVIVTHEPVEPRSIAHASLLKPLPQGQIDIPLPQSSPENAPTAATGGGRAAADMLLGVSAAAAAEVPDAIRAAAASGERTRASVALARQQRITALETAVAGAQTQLDETSAKIKAANEALKAAMDVRRQTETELKRHAAAVARADAERAAAGRRLRDFILRTSAVAAEAELIAAAAEEDGLEADMLKHLGERDMAAADYAALTKTATAQNEAIEAARAHRQSLADEFKRAGATLATAKQDLQEAKRALARQDKPITVLVSRKAGKIFVRQGFDDIYEAPVTFKNPEAPLGTQVFHALDYTEDGNDLVWQAVTAAYTSTERPAPRRKKGRYSRAEPEPVPAPVGDRVPQTPQAALDRVEIPAEVAEALAEHIKPGSAIIISDETKSYETGKYTDLIVVTR